MRMHQDMMNQSCIPVSTPLLPMVFPTARVPYFSTLDRVHQLRSEARSWSGTPFHAHGKYKGLGTDCVWVAEGIYRALGVIPPQDFGWYTVGAGSHLEASLVAAGVVRSGAFENALPVTIGAVLPGDLLGFKLGRVIHHVGIVLEGTRFIHSIQTVGVTESDLRDPTWSTRLYAIWRPMQN